MTQLVKVPAGIVKWLTLIFQAAQKAAPWFCLSWAQWIWLQTHTFNKPDCLLHISPWLEAHSCSITKSWAHMCMCWYEQGTESLISFHTEILRNWKNILPEVSGCLFKLQICLSQHSRLSLSCPAKQFLLAANQFCSPSTGTGDFYHLFSVPWRSCKLFFPFCLIQCLFLRKMPITMRTCILS